MPRISAVGATDEVHPIVIVTPPAWTMYPSVSATDRAVLEVRGAGRPLAARLVWALHVVVVAFFLFGWALPWPEALAFTLGLSDRVVYFVVWGGGSIAALRLVPGGHA
jgi:hypothetical protein